MKRHIISLLAIFLFFSCDSFLDEKTYGLVVPSTYPQSISSLEKCVNALYSINNSMYREAGCFVACMGGDDVTTLPGGNKGAFLQFDIFNAQDNNDRIEKQWDTAYDVIKQANVIIGAMDNIKEPTLSIEYVEAQKNRALGQAYFLRALAYYNLVRTFGEVPIVDGLTIDYELTKAPFGEIYTLIETDLINAEKLIPADYRTAPNASDMEKTTYYARASLGAVKSLMASVYLTWAGFPLKDNSKYALAAAKAKEVIDNANTYGYRLLENYGDLWKWESGWKEVGNAENVFTCHYNTSVGDWSDGGTESNGNMLAPASMFPENFGGWSDAFAELTFFNEFPEGPRKDATFLTSGQATPESPVIGWDQFTASHPYYKKYIEIPGFDYTNMSAYIDWWSSRTSQVIRYAEVLLIYAEAQPMADGSPNQMAYSCLNQVRNRAGLPDMTTGLSNTAFRDSVVMERKWEFAGLEPCARWYDMVRTETVAATTAKRNSKEIPVVGAPNDQSHERYFAPIPQKDKMLNPNL
ncbi:hypothetical protein M2459_003177 [Parabacteroides sp. PF5-5]|uniref:RagB/SusD family nutrient uptake outer membrane protein n=1 Tax=unclassified Parabacteroides TaxID=2649774 RepID=UPI0024744B13|nr:MULTISPECIES: RagB/SusD family nutrient uptake outer membrane protein [unclassified Parabacteroides]MDH6306453.1 hypothetical protein [Parabacteroides sp. PH5-39]MDH6317395.1 hypothetical protein [Parabacteroides sp. PF5-13]MDH6321164.1 hypothetical protein [Parabacteroides sp. PH5-13]MDH6324896.1 hypothetical protein [Parabacteroides sp. PH5-8]MDH6328580.1 hypothetical protein [Parabacteroides sp. PH5-41]